MAYIKKLPFIIAFIVAMLVGLVSYYKGVDVQTVYVRMTVSLAVFFVAGIFYTKIVEQLEKEIAEKKKSVEKLSGQTVSGESGSKVPPVFYRPRMDDNDEPVAGSNIKVQEETDTEKPEINMKDEFSPWDLNDIINYKVQKK
ncbi:MAG TPA: hypothetical protein GXX49_08850 [Clostridiaceae bacterium]|nr:hypothetical protein [Clostridiaceae bacterium]